MGVQYPQEILDQQARVRKELAKLAKMRTDHLKSIGQMPPSASKSKPAQDNASRVAPSSESSQHEVAAS